MIVIGASDIFSHLLGQLPVMPDYTSTMLVGGWPIWLLLLHESKYVSQ